MWLNAKTKFMNYNNNNNNNDNHSGFYMVPISTYKNAQGTCIIITPALAPGNLVAHSAFEGRNSCRVPIYYTSVERDNCG